MAFPRNPRFRRAENFAPMDLTARDAEILRAVNRHRFLRSHQIADLVDGNCQQVLRRMDNTPFSRLDWTSRNRAIKRLFLENAFVQSLRTFRVEVIFAALLRIPASFVAKEYNIVPVIQEYLCRATRILPAVFGILKRYADVAHTITNAVQLPRSPAGFVIMRRAKVPCSVRKWSELAHPEAHFLRYR